MARLVVNREEAGLVTHELTRDIVTIGSAPLNHIVIDDPAVSAQHAIRRQLFRLPNPGIAQRHEITENRNLIT